MKIKLNIKKLQKKFNALRSSYDMRGFADLMVEIFRMHKSFLKNGQPAPSEFIEFYKHVDTYSYVILMELSKHNGKAAVKYIEAILEISPNLANMMFHLYYIMGMAYYEAEDYPKAEENWKIYLTFRQQKWQDSDEMALFYLGNTFAYEKIFLWLRLLMRNVLK